MSTPCKYIRKNSKLQPVEWCKTLANDSGYCPRHVLMLEAEKVAAAKKEKDKQAKKVAELKRRARR